MKRIAVLVAFVAAACSSEPTTPADGADASVAAPTSGLCGDLRFEAQRRGTGEQPVGGHFLGGNGHDFLVVHADCRFWVQESPQAGVQQGTLTAEAAGRLSERLRLAAWQEYVGHYTIGACDGPASAVSFGGQVITVSPVCHAEDTSERVIPILEAVRAAIEELSAVGAAVDRARYQLVAEGSFDEGGLTSSAPAYTRAPRWPLSAPASEVATPYVVASTTPEAAVTHVVAGDDAR